MTLTITVSLPNSSTEVMVLTRPSNIKAPEFDGWVLWTESLRNVRLMSSDADAPDGLMMISEYRCVPDAPKETGV